VSAVGLRPWPDPPHTNTFLIHAPGEEDAVAERVISFMEREKVRPCGGWRATDVPGFVVTEVAVHDGALEHDPAQVAAWLAEVTGA
jgi:hypothetical protein